MSSTKKQIELSRGFVMPSPTLIMAGVIIALSLSNVILFNLYRSTVNEYSQFKADVYAQQMELAREAERVKEEAERINKETAQGWGAAVDYWRNRPPITVRVPTGCNPSGLRPNATSTEGLNAASAQQGFSAAVDVAQCEMRLNNAVFDAAKLIHLQQWVEDQHAATQKE